MQILVRRFYQNVHGKTVQPAIYDIRDPKLHGLGEYLLNVGIADAISTNDIEEPEIEQRESITVDITALARELAIENGILEEVIEHFESLGINKIGIADVRAYLAGE
jgi:hypothetical protein